jgi:hypothetical protein
VTRMFHVPGHPRAMRTAMRAVLSVSAALALLATFAEPASAAPKFGFTKVADSVEDGFDPFSFECAAINNRGDIAFRAARGRRNETQLVQGIYRANADGRRRTTIAEFGDGFDFLGQFPSINDLGDVAFAARDFSPDDFSETQNVMLGDGGRPMTIATTAAGEFHQFGFEPTVNNSGVVAFKAQLNTLGQFTFDQGLFSGQDGNRASITTHYLSSTSQFSEFGPLNRPSINNLGDIAFAAPPDGGDTSGIFVTQGTGFTTIAAADPNINVGWPALNDAGTVAFHRLFNDRAGEELVTGNGGALTVAADTRGPFQSFSQNHGITPPALNNGDIAFAAELDAGGSGIFVGPKAVADRVIATGDRLDGSIVQSVGLCDESLNDSGQLAFQVGFADPTAPFNTRVAIYRATPQR